MHLIYVSAACKPMSSEGLSSLLGEARDRNQRLGVTGMLLYHNRNFMQVLEGDGDAVLPMYEKIRLDLRHTLVTTVLQGRLDTRDFPDWSMGFREPGLHEMESLPGHSRILEKGFEPTEFLHDPSIAHRMLLTFRDWN